MKTLHAELAFQIFRESIFRIYVTRTTRFTILRIRCICSQKRKADGKTVSFSQTFDGGDEGDRTPDLLHAMQALSQLSYAPVQRTLLLYSKRFRLASLKKEIFTCPLITSRRRNAFHSKLHIHRLRHAPTKPYGIDTTQSCGEFRLRTVSQASNPAPPSAS